MKENPADARTVLNNDMLAPEGYGEIIGGSQREDDYDKLLARIRAERLPEDAYSWYLDLRKYGTFVHAGFGLGVERTVAWICGIPHIREAIASLRARFTTAKRRSPISSATRGSGERGGVPSGGSSASSSCSSSFTFSRGPRASGQSNPTPAARSCNRNAIRSGGKEGGRP